MKASFLERIGAYIIDTLIVSVIASLICYSLPNTDINVENTISSLSQRYTAGEITTDEFYSEYNDLLYQNQKDTLISTGVSLALTIGYFVVFQYMNKGQTLGKKLLNLRVVDKETKKPTTIVKGIIRSVIVLGIASTTISLILINIVNKKTYIPCYFTISIIENIFIIVSLILVIFKEDSRGLHDLMAGTMVIKERR